MKFAWIGVAAALALSACKEEATHTLACGTPAPDQNGFGAFIAELQKAVKEKNVDAVLAATDPHIKTSFGPDNGKDVFIARYSLNLSPESSTFWDKMTTILNLGIDATQTKADEVIYPCTFGDLPKTDWIAVQHADRMPFGYKVVVAGDTMLTNDKGETIRPLELYETVLVEEDRLKTHDGLTGFADQQKLRSPLDHRAIFNRIDGAWKMTAFVAGD